VPASLPRIEAGCRITEPIARRRSYGHITWAFFEIRRAVRIVGTTRQMDSGLKIAGMTDDDGSGMHASGLRRRAECTAAHIRTL